MDDKNSEKDNFDFSKIEKILDELKLLFQKRGYQIDWKDLEGQNVYQTLSALSMASPQGARPADRAHWRIELWHCLC
mgnify:CR=1 FL=1